MPGPCKSPNLRLTDGLELGTLKHSQTITERSRSAQRESALAGSLQPAGWLLTHSHRDGRHLEFCCSAAYSHVVQFTAGFSGFYFGLGNRESTSGSVRRVTTPFIEATSWPSQSTAPNDCGTA